MTIRLPVPILSRILALDLIPLEGPLESGDVEFLHPGVIGMVGDFVTAQTFMYISSGISLALPLAFYWMITGRVDKEQRRQDDVLS